MNLFDKLRILWVGCRYDFWLDLHSVPRKKRRELRRELKANLAEAATSVGTSKALLNVGSVRTLASVSTRDGLVRSRWSAGLAVGLTTLCALVVLFLTAGLYYTEGVLDSGVTGRVSSSLFPFLGSTIEVNNQGVDQGFEVGVSPGPIVFLLPLALSLVVAKPWRSLKRAAVDAEAPEGTDLPDIAQ